MKIQPPATLLVGPSGTGKTSALATYAKAGIEVFVLGTEPGAAESLLDHARRIGAPIDKIHWRSVLATTSGFDALERMISNISAMTFEGLSKIQNDPGKSAMRAAAMDFLNTIQDFKCDRTGKSYGSPLKWGDDRAFCIDSLTGWSTIAWKLTVGHKPTGAPAEYGISQNFIHDLLMKIMYERSCYFTLTAHVEKEPDELSGIKKLMVSTIGQKLAPKIPLMFSDVVLAKRADSATDYHWSTLESGVDLKNRNLPAQAKLKPDMSQVIEAYNRRKGLALAAE